MVTVSDLLKVKGSTVWSIHPTATTINALNLLAEKNVGALVVMDEDVLVGIVSERDFVRQISASRACALDEPVKQRMKHPVFTIRPEQTIEDCMKLMTEKHIRHVPVLNGSGALVGLISIGDVVREMISDQAWLIENLERYIHGGGR